jgi:hypothetical protein
MTHFITRRLSVHYERRLLDYAHNRLHRTSSSFEPYSGQKIESLGVDMYAVESRSKIGTCYVVDMSACVCTCHIGETGKLCKHMHFIVSETSFNTNTSYHLSDQRELMYVLATGNLPPAGWLQTLHEVMNPTGMQQGEVSLEHITLHSQHIDLPTRESVTTVTADPDNEAELQQAHNDFLEVLQEKIRIAKDSPRELLAAYKAATATLTRISTTNATISMLHCLGKYSEGVKKKYLGKIPVQTTSVSRRKKCLRGRTPGEAGRPRKNSILLQNLHTYSMPSRKIRHNLSNRIARNTALGKNLSQN